VSPGLEHAITPLSDALCLADKRLALASSSWPGLRPGTRSRPRIEGQARGRAGLDSLSLAKPSNLVTGGRRLADFPPCTPQPPRLATPSANPREGSARGKAGRGEGGSKERTPWQGPAMPAQRKARAFLPKPRFHFQLSVSEIRGLPSHTSRILGEPCPPPSLSGRPANQFSARGLWITLPQAPLLWRFDHSQASDRAMVSGSVRAVDKPAAMTADVIRPTFPSASRSPAEINAEMQVVFGRLKELALELAAAQGVNPDAYRRPVEERDEVLSLQRAAHAVGWTTQRLRRHIVRHNAAYPRDPIGYQPGGVPNAPWCIPTARLRRYVRDQRD